MSSSGYSHLSHKERDLIESLLNRNSKLIDIANELKRDPRSIKREIVRHRYLYVRENAKNKCGLQLNCKKVRLCDLCSSGQCKFCSIQKCFTFCLDFQKEPDCKTTQRFPYVCNGCSDLKACKLPKFFYRAHDAHIEYKNNVSVHKQGPKLNEVQLKNLDYTISQGVRNGHSIGVIIRMNELDIAPSTVYRHIDNQLLSVKNIDLKRKVRYHKRHTKKPLVKVSNYNYLTNRTFSDYGQFILDNPDVNVWQMDTIMGITGKDEPVVLSLLFTKSNLQLLFRLNACTQEEVNRMMNSIREHLGSEIYAETFSCILTDNGKEFKDPLSLEIDPETGEKLISVFYCESRRSDQKGKCEKNHVHFREFIPKGTSFFKYTHDHFNYISSQINNYPRRSLLYQSPYQVSALLLNEKVFELNRLKFIPHNKVVLEHLSIK